MRTQPNPNIRHPKVLSVNLRIQNQVLPIMFLLYPCVIPDQCQVALQLQLLSFTVYTLVTFIHTYILMIIYIYNLVNLED
jgi:hypothetical protein